MDKYIRDNDNYYAQQFEILPEAKRYIVIASSIEPNKFHKGEFVMKQILRDEKGRKCKRMVFIEKSHIKRIMEELRNDERKI